MHRPFTEVSDPILPGPDAPRGLQMSFFEMLGGSLFGFLGLSAPALTILLSILFAPLSLIFLTLLAERLGCTRRVAVVSGIFYFLLVAGPLRRVIHQSWSLPYVLGTLLLLLAWWKSPTRAKTIGLGVLLGLVPGIYVWSWTYLWAVFGIFIGLSIAERLQYRDTEEAKAMFWRVLKVGCIAIVTALPFFVLMWTNAQHPESAVVSIRSSLIHAREFESLTRSAVLFCFTLLTVLWMVRSQEWKRTIPLGSFIIALFVVLHQQFITGLVLSYWTHYYMYVAAASVLAIAVLLSLSRRGLVEYGMIALASVFLLAACIDYSGPMYITSPLYRYKDYQHLRGLTDALSATTGSTVVLSDPETSLIIGTHTDIALAYTEYLRHVLISTRELADRYCLTELSKGSPPDTVLLAHNVKELSGAGQAATEEVYKQNIEVMKEACAWVTASPARALQQYGVTHLAWDEKNYPEWKIDPTLFVKAESGSGWSVWRVR